MQEQLSSISDAFPTTTRVSAYTETVLQMTLLMTAPGKILFDFTLLAPSADTPTHTEGQLPSLAPGEGLCEPPEL